MNQEFIVHKRKYKNWKPKWKVAELFCAKACWPASPLSTMLETSKEVDKNAELRTLRTTVNLMAVGLSIKSQRLGERAQDPVFWLYNPLSSSEEGF